MNSYICECEKSNTSARIRCFKSALVTFYNARQMTFKVQELNLNKVECISEIKLDSGLDRKPIFEQITEVLILRNFLEGYSQSHPAFALETNALSTIQQYARLFKDL